MRYEETRKKIYTTTNYDMFKILDGNRSVKNARVVKMVESIEKHGWLTQPILVNEKFEVIDGQSRLEALKRLEMPIDFVIDEGIGIEECRTLNMYQKNWSISDFIDAYIAIGKCDYKWLKLMLDKYAVIPKATIFNVTSKTDGVVLMNGRGTDIIKSGEFKVSDCDKEYFENKLFYFSRFAEIAKKIKGRADIFYSAINFLYEIDGVDRERLYETISNSRYVIIAAGTVEGYMSMFSEIYNKGLKKAQKIDFLHEYKIA